MSPRVGSKFSVTSQKEMQCQRCTGSFMAFRPYNAKWCDRCRLIVQHQQNERNRQAAIKYVPLPDDFEDKLKHTLVKFRLTRDEYDEIIKRQNGRCGICADHRKPYWVLVPDHDHLTGQVRGFLCTSCNTGIGKLGDSVAGVKRALAYLQAAQLGSDMGCSS